MIKLDQFFKFADLLEANVSLQEAKSRADFDHIVEEFTPANLSQFLLGIVDSNRPPRTKYADLRTFKMLVKKRWGPASDDPSSDPGYIKFAEAYALQGALFRAFYIANVPDEHWIDLLPEQFALTREYALKNQAVDIEDPRFNELRTRINQRCQKLISMGFRELQFDGMAK